jgi:hypothetical protein
MATPTEEAHMRSRIVLCSLLVLAGCAKADKKTGGTGGTETGMAGAADTAAATSPTASLTEVAGKWQTVAIDEAGDTIGMAEMQATADTSGWTLTFPKQKPIPLQVVAVGGDSVVTAAHYHTFDNKKAQIQSRAVNRFQGDKMTGTLEAHILVGGTDSLIHARIEGTRAP